MILNITSYDLNTESCWFFGVFVFWGFWGFFFVFCFFFFFGSVDSVDRSGELGEQLRDSKLNNLRLVIRINTTFPAPFFIPKIAHEKVSSTFPS